MTSGAIAIDFGGGLTWEPKHRPPKECRSVETLHIHEIDEAQKMRNQVTWSEIGHIFAGVTRAGAASRRPYGEKFYSRERTPCANTAHGAPRSNRKNESEGVRYITRSISVMIPSSVFSAKSACASSIRSGGQRRRVVSPEPSTNRPLRKASSTMRLRMSGAFSLVF